MISTNNLACLYTQSVCDKNSRISCIFLVDFRIWPPLLFIIDHFKGFFYGDHGVFHRGHDVFELFISACRPQVHKNTNVLLILQVWDIILFYL